MTKKEPEKFEESLLKLEGIVRKLEQGDVELEESLSLYEEGIKLFRSCNARLEDAKKKVEILLQRSSGEMEPVPFDEESSQAAASASTKKAAVKPARLATNDSGDQDEIPF